MDSLRTCYDKIKNVIGSEIEPYESVELVERYRQFWKPEVANVILLAESHVHTDDEDREFSLNEKNNLYSYPSKYARFVYCLAYGENTLIKNGEPMKNTGTYQYWKLFYSCVNKVQTNACFHPILKENTTDKQRILNKIDLLNTLKMRGIWLVDASIVALYKKGKKPPELSDAIRLSWDNYTRQVVDTANPKHVIVIGKGVGNIVASGLTKGKYTIIKQPNAHLKSEENNKNFQICFERCTRYGKTL
ncbi:MAG TPA: hypothetical protein HPQ00_01180 [Magnetococcales bacterium]|nr:hypothetical protein [Magnetococcales bacterium]